MPDPRTHGGTALLQYPADTESAGCVFVPVGLLRLTLLVLLLLTSTVSTGLAATIGMRSAQGDTITRTSRSSRATPRVHTTARVKADGSAMTFAPADTVRVSRDFFTMTSDDTRDSLLLEIRRYSRVIAGLRDSLDLSDEDLTLSDQNRERVEATINELTVALSQIGQELSRMDLEIADNRISLLDESGEGIIINIPENFDEQLSEGFQAISQAILSQLPDTVGFSSEIDWGWATPDEPEPQRQKRQITHGNIIKVGDDLHITDSDDVRGNVVVVFGASQISGRVDGNAVVVFGDLVVDDTAEITGKVINVLGRYDEGNDPNVGGVVVVNPFQMGPGGKLGGWLAGGPETFILSQGMFLLVLILSVLAIGIAPRDRIESVQQTLQQNPASAAGVGLLVWLVVSTLSVILAAILVLTVIGIPIALLLVVVLGFAAVIAIAVVGTQIGRRLCLLFGWACKVPWLTTLIGIMVLHALSFMADLLGLWPNLDDASDVLAGIGGIVKLLAFIFGLGAITISRLGTRRVANTGS